MQNSDLRQQTFSTSSWPYSKRARKYKGLPRALSQAGFYFAPTSTVKDRCLCYLCGKSISGLADGEEEDLLALHSAANSSCPLVVIGEQVAGTAFGEETCWSKNLQSARMRTFADWWPHSDGPEDSLNIERMAAAGFCYAGDSDNNDNCICRYCGLELGGWEPEDDPRAEHMKRKPDCLFLNDPDKSVEKSEQSLKRKAKEDKKLEPKKAPKKTRVTKAKGIPAEEKVTKTASSKTNKLDEKKSSLRSSERLNLNHEAPDSQDNQEEGDVFEFQDKSITDIFMSKAAPGPIAMDATSNGESSVEVPKPKRRAGRKRANVIEDSFDQSVLSEKNVLNLDENEGTDSGIAKKTTRPPRGRKGKNESTKQEKAKEAVDSSILDDSMIEGDHFGLLPGAIDQYISLLEAGANSSRGLRRIKADKVKCVDTNDSKVRDDSSEPRPGKRVTRRNNNTKVSSSEERQVKPKRGQRKKECTESPIQDASVLNESMISMDDSVSGETERPAIPMNQQRKNETDVEPLDESMQSFATADESVLTDADQKPKRSTRRKKGEVQVSALEEKKPIAKTRRGKSKKEEQLESLVDFDEVAESEIGASDMEEVEGPTSAHMTRKKTKRGEAVQKETAGKKRAGKRRADTKDKPDLESGRKSKKRVLRSRPGEENADAGGSTFVDSLESKTAKIDAAEPNDESRIENTVMIDDSISEAPVTVQKLDRAVDILERAAEMSENPAVHSEKENSFEQLMSSMQNSKIKATDIPSKEDIMIMLGKEGAGGNMTEAEMTEKYRAAGAAFLEKRMESMKRRFNEQAELCLAFLQGQGNQ
ncbi:MAG: hypothetical protein SGCHY_000339 [Lobulomycetales sp.]